MRFTFSLSRFRLALFLLLGTAGAVAAQSTLCQVAHDFSAPVTTAATQAVNTWYTDRYAPASFASPVNFAGNDRLKQSIAAADGTSSRTSSFAAPFYNTQGRRLDLPTGIISMDIDMYVPSDWATSGRRMAGFWGTAVNASDVNSFPIVEFTSDGGARFRGFTGLDAPNTWIDMGLPTGFTYNSTVKVRIELLPSGEFRYSAGDRQVITSSFTANASVRIKDVILQGHNTDVGVTYDIYWDNFCAGSAVGAAPALSTFTVSSPLGGSPNCAATLKAIGTGKSFVVTGPNGYAYSTVYRTPGMYETTSLNVKQQGSYTLTIYGEAGDTVTQTIQVTGNDCP